MTSNLSILSQTSIDSSISLILTSPSGKKILLNCGEGTQRLFLEKTATRHKLKQVNRICLSEVSHRTVGGLGGMILTSADMMMKEDEGSEGGLGSSLEVFGPRDTERYVRSLRHFIRREKMCVMVREVVGESKNPAAVAATSGTAKWSDPLMALGNINSNPNRNNNNNNNNNTPNKKNQKSHKPNRKKKKTFRDGHRDNPISPEFEITPIHTSFQWNDNSSPHSLSGSKRVRNEDVTQKEIDIVSYLFHTPKLAGKFMAEKAVALGIPPGPLRAKLKAGLSVTFTKAGGEEVTVESTEVVTPPHPGIAVVVISCPNLEVLKQLQTHATLSQFQSPAAPTNSTAATEAVLECIAHLVPPHIYHSPSYQKWMHTFDSSKSKIKHIVLFTEELHDSNLSIIDPLFYQPTPFRASTKGALKRSFLSKEVFPAPFMYSDDTSVPLSVEGEGKEEEKKEVEEKEENETVKEEEADSNPVSNVVFGKAGMEYILLPRLKQAIETSLVPTPITTNFIRTGLQTHETQALQAAQSIQDNSPTTNQQEKTAEFILTGTGAAIPCKHRNVTGMYLQFQNSNAMLFDCGEGTLGQLFRSWMSTFTPNGEDASNDQLKEMIRERLSSIKVIWISHPHADHHFGLARFLSLRHTILQSSTPDPLLVIAPISLFYFLREYSFLDVSCPTFQRSYIQLQCQDILYHKNCKNIFSDKLYNDLGITNIQSVPVTHCPNAYAILLETTLNSFGRKIVYSGDCRPSALLAKVAHGCDLLIHEATFTNEKQSEALAKKHSTVEEAIDIAIQMGVRKALILTHFSQRYPKMPSTTTTATGNNLQFNHKDGLVDVNIDTTEGERVVNGKEMTLSANHTAEKLTSPITVQQTDITKQEEENKNEGNTIPSPNNNANDKTATTTTTTTTTQINTTNEDQMKIESTDPNHTIPSSKDNTKEDKMEIDNHQQTDTKEEPNKMELNEDPQNQIIPSPNTSNKDPVTNQQTFSTGLKVPIIFGFDFMRLQSNTLDLAARLTPALQLLYPPEDEEEVPANPYQPPKGWDSGVGNVE